MVLYERRNKMKRSPVIVFVALALTLLFAVSAIAGPVLERVQKRGELIVGTVGTMPPMNMTTKDGRIVGLDADIARFMAAAMGVKVKFQTMPFAQLLGALRLGNVDMVMASMAMLPERNMKVIFVGPYFLSGKGILMKQEAASSIRSITDLDQSGKTYAALEGSTSQMFVEKVTTKATLVKIKKYEDAINMIFAGKVDALIADFPYCLVTAYQYQDKGLVTTDEPFTFEPLGIALPEGDPLLVNFVQNALKMLEGTGTLKEMRQRWFRDNRWMEQIK
jgi:polar amino acid transport system substrate-binding protein